MYPTMLPFDVVLPDEPVAVDLTRLYQRLHTLPDTVPAEACATRCRCCC
jgi:hypothetical protein